MLKILQLSLRGCRTHAQILSNSLRFDVQVQNFKKEDTFMHDVQLLDRQDCPRFGWNLNRKTALRRAKNPLAASVRGPYLSSPSSASRKTTTLRKKVM